ncbi:hypothetical protein ACFQ78_11270 [Streptomyces sp. NPDC056519]|uniref:hypothetical protein n=1 Tax=Streptomyces sp. NPDC056519 TaxID=3345849 RepID=UPI0036BC21E5
MESLIAEVDRDAVDRFLSAVDGVMNSNTLLLKAEAGRALTVDNRQGLLDAYLRSDLFEQMMREADRRRGWYILSDFPVDPDEDEDESGSGSQGQGGSEGEAEYRPGGSARVPLLRAGCRATVTALGPAQFRERLHWMLAEAPSPYNSRLPEDEAARLVGDFLGEVLAPGQGWAFASVEPDFLRSSEYHTDETPLYPFYL